MKGSRKNTAQTKAMSANNIAEAALILAIENTNLDADTIKALRLTCKRTKLAADAKVMTFLMVPTQDPEAVERSGLLRNIIKLDVRFNLSDIDCLDDFNISDDDDSGDSIDYFYLNFEQKLYHCQGLLNLAVHVCSNSLKVLEVKIDDPYNKFSTYASFLGAATWESLNQLSLYSYLSHGSPSGIFSSPTCLPALKHLHCNPCADDLLLLCNAAFVENLTNLFLGLGYLDANPTPATMAAMRSLVQKATNLKFFALETSVFDFFDSENLMALESLKLSIIPPNMIFEWNVDFPVVLARPWPKLQSLDIEGLFGGCFLYGPHLIRILEAEDTLPVLKKLRLSSCRFTVNAPMSCVRRPHLEELSLEDCPNGHELISKLAQLVKDDAGALPSLRLFQMICKNETPIASAREAISKFLSCPQMAALETLAITDAEIGDNETGLLYDIMKYCPKVKRLDLRYNKMKRRAVTLLLRSGQDMGALPELKELGILEHTRDFVPPYMPPNMPEFDMQNHMRRVWRNVICF